jgi:adenosylcobinamide-phosphate synthase
MLILCAYGLDVAIGDPPGVPHPVRWMGAAIEHGERAARSRFSATPRGERLAGAALVALVVGASAASTALALALARRVGRRAHRATEVILAASSLATRDLLTEAHSVLLALQDGDLPRARARVARIVGRDTAELDTAGVARAVIETLAESTCDGIVAPLFFLACGGAPAAVAFKAISTLDSLIGHPEPPYRFFGTAAARLDDVANLIPARITAFAVAFAAPLFGGSAQNAIASMRRDARKHRSPNAGYPEAALAGALGVRLGGPLRYDGVVVDAPLLNATGRVPGPRDVAAAMRICALASLMSAALFAAVARRA